LRAIVAGFARTNSRKTRWSIAQVALKTRVLKTGFSIPIALLMAAS